MADLTLRDLNRRPIQLNKNLIGEALPEYFAESYPVLITLLEKYYENLDSDGNFGDLLKSLPTSRDISQVKKAFITYIEDELLLGENYLEGIFDNRTGAELSNNYYRTKGTKYSIERFFRSFFQTDPVVEYGKNLYFKVGETPVGPESQKYIINNKVYQPFGILIKTDRSSSEWIDLYKLFAHPAGMYVGAEVQLVARNQSISFDYMPIPKDPDAIDPIYEGIGRFNTLGILEISGLIPASSDDPAIRVSFQKSRVYDWTDSAYSGDVNVGDQFGSVEHWDIQYQTVEDVIIATSATLDEDSDGGDRSARTTTNVKYDTMDKAEFLLYPDSA